MLTVTIDQSEGISGADIPEQAVKKMRTGSAALSLSSPRAFFAFLFTERLSTTISEPGTGYFRLGNLVSSLKNRVKKPWKVRLHIEVEPCVIFISFYFRSLHSSRRRRRHVFNKQQDATERTLRRRGCGTD